MMEAVATNCECADKFRCGACGRQQRVMKRCTRCRSVMYCSRECQIKQWHQHREACYPPASPPLKSSQESHKELMNSLPTEEVVMSKTPITIKCNHKKHNVTLYNVESSTGRSLMNSISVELNVPLMTLKLVGKGKIINEDNIKEMLTKCKIFQGLGEESENEDGLHPGDIETIIEQLHVDRNKAIRSLRSCNGDLIDAIIDLGNKI